MVPAPARGLSVVVPSHGGRLPQVRQLLASLTAARRACPEPVEVIVVDDAADAEAEELRRACAERGACYLRGPERAGAKRNVGFRAARFDVVLFIDSDCVATRDLLKEHLRTLRAGDDSVGAVLGMVAMAGAEPFHWQVAGRSSVYNRCNEHAACYERVLWGVTANFSCRRAALERIGGFDPDTPTPVGGEDVDLGVRLNAAGCAIATNPRAVVFHARAHVTGLRPIARSVFTYGRADVYLLMRHPRRAVAHPQPAVALGALAVVAAALALLPAAGLALGAVALVPPVWRLARSIAAGPGRDRARPLWYRARLAGAAYALDRLYTLGSLFEAVRQGRPLLALRRFAYTRGPEFVWRS